MSERLGIRLNTVDSPLGLRLTDLVGLAVRRNPRRAHLLVSRVLGKHVPTDPALVHGAGLALGHQVAQVLDDGPVIVLGYAETATALGHCVAEYLEAPYLHSTRRPVPGIAPLGGFDESHSHAVSHLLLPTDPSVLLDPRATVVLVDDEQSTGATALGTIAELHRLCPHARYVLASLVDVRSEDDAARAQAVAAELGTTIVPVSLVRGSIELPPDILEAGTALVASLSTVDAFQAVRSEPRFVDVAWPDDVLEGGRHGITAAQTIALGHAAEVAAAKLASEVDSEVLVLGFEELMYAPLRIAAALGEMLPVRYSTTTRSPVLPVDDPGYAIRGRLTFDAHDDPSDGPGPRFAYNVPAGTGTVVLVVDESADTPALRRGLLPALGGMADQVLWVRLPTGVR